MKRTPIDALLDGVEWTEVAEQREPIPGEPPFATHSGVLEFAGIKLRCYQLNDGQRVFDADDVARFFGGELVERKPLC